MIYYQNDMIVLTDNPLDWFAPATNLGQHVGWYMDLPGHSERVINDVLIRDGKVIAVASVPSDSPCSTGGSSAVFVMDACTGGRIEDPVFDLNGDGLINEADLVNIGTTANPILVAPTGLVRTGMWYTPAILALPSGVADILYFSTSLGDVRTVLVDPENVGMFYWRSHE